MKRHFTTAILAIIYMLVILGGIYAFDTLAQTKAGQIPELQKTELVLYDWSKVNVLTVEPKLDAMLEKHRAWITERLAKGAPYTWKNFVLPINEMDDELYQLWFPVYHISEVFSPTESLREQSEIAFTKCQEKITQYEMDILQNKNLYEAYKATNNDTSLLPEQKMALSNTLRDYRLSGIELSGEKKQRLTEIAKELAMLQKKFSDNKKYSEESWKKHVTDERILDGLPSDIKTAAKAAAKELKMDGYVLGLDENTIGYVLAFAKNRELRKEVFRAANTIASDGAFDNTEVVEKILKLRYEKAKLLGYGNYAEMALATRMAKSTDEVMSFLDNMKVHSRPFAENEFKKLGNFINTKENRQAIEPWDVSFYEQRMKMLTFSFSLDTPHASLTIKNVIGGLDSVIQKLYGITLYERKDVSVWHKDVKFYEVRNVKDNSLIGGIYMDLFQRPGKKAGGWAIDAMTRYQRTDGVIQLPVGLIVLNFEPPVPGTSAILSLPDVEDLFHEFGHNTQILLTKVIARDVSGINGVPWDGVELASQFMGNFAWQPEVIKMFEAQSAKAIRIPVSLITKAHESKIFGKGMNVSRQLVVGIFDFRLHSEYVPDQTGEAERFYSDAYRETAMTPFYPWMKNFPNRFSHIFAGGYSAGYYSYLWAEELSADDFSLVIKNGKIDWSVGKKFEDEILSRGGSRPFMESNTAFLGRTPTVDALMKQYGFAK
jgi:oligopeptidase A